MRRILFLLSMHAAYARDIHAGLTEVVTRAGGVVVTPPSERPLEKSLARGPWHGALVMRGNLEGFTAADTLIHSGIRCLMCGYDALIERVLPVLASDPRAAGAVAGRWARQRGYASVVLVTGPWKNYRVERQTGLRSVFPDAPEPLFFRGAKGLDEDSIRRWYRSLPPNCLLVCDSSSNAMQLYAALRRWHPSLLCLGDDPAACLGHRPRLTALDLGFRRLGRLAGQRLLQQTWPPLQTLELVAPEGVILRDSTPAPSPLVTQIEAVINRALPQRLRVPELAQALGCSRSQLERDLAAAGAPSPATLINRAWATWATAPAQAQIEPTDLARFGHLSGIRGLRGFLGRWS